MTGPCQYPIRLRDELVGVLILHPDRFTEVQLTPAMRAALLYQDPTTSWELEIMPVGVTPRGFPPPNPNDRLVYHSGVRGWATPYQWWSRGGGWFPSEQSALANAGALVTKRRAQKARLAARQHQETTR